MTPYERNTMNPVERAKLEALEKIGRHLDSIRMWSFLTFVAVVLYVYHHGS